MSEAGYVKRKIPMMKEAINNEENDLGKQKKSYRCSPEFIKYRLITAT